MSEEHKLLVCVVLTGALVVAELILGQFSHCLTLLVLTNQTLYNLMTLSFFYVAKMLSRGENSLKSTFGWARIEVVGSLFSLVFLASLSFASSIECIQTIVHSGHLDVMHHSFSICILAGVHFVVWIIIFCLIGGYSHQQSEVIFNRGSGGQVSLLMPSIKTKEAFVSFSLDHMFRIPFRHVFRDLAVVSMLLVVAMIGHISATRFTIPNIIYIDPCVALIGIIMLVSTSLGLGKESCLILLQTIPAKLNIEEVKSGLFAQFPTILNVHDMHIWCLVPGNVVATLHVIFKTEQVTCPDLDEPLTINDGFFLFFRATRTRLRTYKSTCSQKESPNLPSNQRSSPSRPRTKIPSCQKSSVCCVVRRAKAIAKIVVDESSTNNLLLRLI